MKTLPSRMMRHTATLTVPLTVSGWHAVGESGTVQLGRVHVQRTRALQTVDGIEGDMDVRPTAELWFDRKISTPHGIDFTALAKAAEAAGDQLRVTFDGQQYRVTFVDELPDDCGGIHHWRLELI